MHSGVTAVEKSGNHKIGIISATYVAQSTCPVSCSFRGSGCYAEGGNVGMTTKRINETDHTAEQLADIEAAAIRALTGIYPLRVHVVGDCASDYAARAVSGAMADHTRKAGQPNWTYTHAWRDVDRASWLSGANVQASCETAADVKLANERGYATALVVDAFPTSKRYRTDDGSNVIPCPQQTGKAPNCAACGLCFNPAAIESRRQTGTSIGFETHGQGKAKAAAALQRKG